MSSDSHNCRQHQYWLWLFCRCGHRDADQPTDLARSQVRCLSCFSPQIGLLTTNQDSFHSCTLSAAEFLQETPLALTSERKLIFKVRQVAWSGFYYLDYKKKKACAVLKGWVMVQGWGSKDLYLGDFQEDDESFMMLKTNKQREEKNSLWDFIFPSFFSWAFSLLHFF